MISLLLTLLLVNAEGTMPRAIGKFTPNASAALSSNALLWQASHTALPQQHAVDDTTKPRSEPPPYTSRDGRFSVLFPPGYPAPKVTINSIASDNGTIKLYMHSSSNVAEGMCLVSYCDFKGAVIDEELKQRILDGAKEGALADMLATLESETPMTLGNYPGRSVRFSAVNNSDTVHGRFDFYLVGIRLYQVGFIGIDSLALGHDSITRYFDSFTLRAESPQPNPRGKSKRR